MIAGCPDAAEANGTVFTSVAAKQLLPPQLYCVEQNKRLFLGSIKGHLSLSL